MKYYILLAVFLFGSFFIGQNSLAISSDIIINEVGAYPTSTHEWIEIWNKGTDPVDIKDWKFWENNTNHNLFTTTSSDSIISIGEFAVICQNAEVFLKDFPNFIGSVFDSAWTNLNESGEEIGLKDEVGNFVERFNYVSTTKYSLERKNPFLNDYYFSNWQENNIGNTVGLQNSNYFVIDSLFSSSTSTVPVNILDVATSSNNNQPLEILSSSSTENNIFDWQSIKLNEIISDPFSGNELVELFNTSSSTLNLADGLICDSSGSGCKLLGGLVAGHDWFVADLLTDRYLNNNGDTVILKDKNNNIVDQVSYGTTNLVSLAKGQALIRKIDGFDTDLDSDWALTNKLTIGSTNELVIPVVNNLNNDNGGGNNIVTHAATSTVVSTTLMVKSNKISTTTKSSVTVIKDSVNISWKLHWPYGVDVGEIGIFSVEGSADPRGGKINFIWNFGDNSSGTGHILEHSFTSSGVYLVSVVASSSAGTINKKEFRVYVGPSFSVVSADVKISSWLVTSIEDQLEYIELQNYLNKPHDISGWKIKNKSGKEYELPDDTIIMASGTLKFFRSIHHLSFDKNGDEIKLMSPNGQEMNKIILLGEKNKNKDLKIASTKVFSNWISVHGIVTVEPKTFSQQFFYISDGQTGFQIYQYKKDFPDLKIGDYISVGGEKSEINGVKRIKIKNRYAVDVLATNKKIEPIDLEKEDVSEELLGSLVKISGDITEIKSNLMYVDDSAKEVSVYFTKGAKINKQALKEGDKIELIGILNQGKDGWQILPRSSSELVVVSHVGEVDADRLLMDQNKQRDITKKYVTTTAGGLTALLLGFLARARGALLITGVKKVVSLASGIIRRG